MKKIKLGVFGGQRGSVMINQLLNSPEGELVAVCDKYQPVLDKVKKSAENAGVSVALYNNFEDFIKHDMDAVVLANYANEHAQYAVRCLRAGKHVMSELLACETMAQAVELAETVEETGLTYTYAENCCYMNTPFEMRLRYQKGDIGEAVYGEGEYLHDCSSIWPDITYGDKNHWRNRMYATYYCTHSLGPLITITGLRPISVTGFEGIPTDNPKEKEIGFQRSFGIEMVTMENGAIFKSIHGPLKREPGSHNYQIYGKLGMMESKRFNDAEFNLYREGEQLCSGEWEKYSPNVSVSRDEFKSSGVTGHGGCDFFSLHFFIEKILGRTDGKWAIDLYQALDMCFCGILAYRSILEGGKPMAIPNFRIKAEREPYRNDHACTNPNIAGDQLLPRSSHKYDELPDSVYEHVRELWLAKNKKA